MKAYFQKLLDYNSWANRRFVGSLEAQALQNQKAYLLMSHLLTAEEVWLCRVQGVAEPIDRLWQQHNLPELKQQLETNSRAWQRAISGVADDDFQKEISYKNSRGETFSTLLSDILGHMLNHGTHHRGQISALMQQEHKQPQVSDYIVYLRSADLVRGRKLMNDGQET